MKIICNLDYLFNKITKYFYPFFLRITFCLLIIFSINLNVRADVPYPDDTGEKVLDLSEKFDSNYLNKLKTDLGQYDNEIRIVFINSQNNINLGLYAPKLFAHWKMSDDSILVVIDPYLNKTGYGLGKNVIEKLRQRQKVEEKENKIKQPEINIDYNNLPAAISDKFSPEIPKVVPNEENKTNEIKGNSNNSGSNSTSGSSNNKPTRPSNPYTLWIILGILLLGILAGGGTFIYRRKQNLKRQIELKTTYSFDGEMLSEQLSEIIEKISGDIEKMSKYKGQTKKELVLHIEKLENIHEKAELFSEKLTNSLEEIELDNLYYISELLDEGKMIIENLENLHKESIGFRKEFKGILEKNAMHLSDIRVNIENCRNLLEEIRTLYNLDLGLSEKKINDCETHLSKAQDLINKNDPLEYRTTLQNIHETIKELKRDFEIIPHLQKQLKENIPQSINASLEENVIDISRKSILKEEINTLRIQALESLTMGNLEKSEQQINQIFTKLNEITSEEVKK